MDSGALTEPFIKPMYQFDSALFRGGAVSEPKLARVVDFEALEAESPDTRRNLLLITVDTLRGDAVEEGSTLSKCMPRLTALANKSVRFERAYSPSNKTSFSFLQVLAGRLDLPTNNEFHPDELLPTAFARAGYSTFAWFTAHDMPPIRLHFDHLRENGFFFHAYKKEYVDAADLLAWGKQQVRGEARFVWLHLMDVHSPYFLQYRGNPPRAGCEEEYEKRAAYIDDLLVDTIEEATAADPNLIWMLSSDHGESRGERNVYGHASNLHEEQVRVPLVVGGAGIQAQRVEEVVSIGRIGPMLMQLGTSEPRSWGTTGWSGERPHANLFSKRRCGLVEQRFKLIANPEEGVVALYDLEADPGETQSRLEAHRAEAERLLAKLQEYGCPVGSLDELL
jgi:membrane-anchored protein YejM (alkaline phosphatase superfamily)